MNCTQRHEQYACQLVPEPRNAKCLEHTEDDHAAAVTKVDGVGSENWLRYGGRVLEAFARVPVVAFIGGYPAI